MKLTLTVMLLTISIFALAAYWDVAVYEEMGSCTSNGIKSIDGDLQIVGESPGFYRVEADYKVKFNPFGSTSGSKSKNVEKYFFTEEFLIELRETGSYVGSEFKVRYDGPTQGACDKIHVYDIGNYPIDAILCYGQPVLGIVEAWTKGDYNGATFRACVKIK